jgi:hypothetical protein
LIALYAKHLPVTKKEHTLGLNIAEWLMVYKIA